MSKFNLGDYLKPEAGVSKSDTGPEQLRYIALDQIDPDANNFYSLEGLDELAANIELIGLQQPLRVRPTPSVGSADSSLREGAKEMRWTVVSGHRRRAACLLIRDGGNHMFDQGVPCLVDYGEASSEMQELRLIYANSSTRVLSSAEQSKQAERVTELLYKLQEQGVVFPGRMRDHVAEACNLSKSKIGRLHAIRSNLLPEMLEAYDAGRINESVAYRISQEDGEMQSNILADQGPVLDHLTADGIAAYVAQRRFLDSRTESPALPATVVPARNAERKADGAAGDICSSLSDLEASLSEKRQPWKKNDEEIQQNRELWARVAERRRQVGLSVTEAYQTDPTEEQFWRDYETGKRLPEFQPHVELSMDDEELCNFADRLLCSIDFLLGRTEIPETAEYVLNNLPQAELCEAAPQFGEGDPPGDGRYFARIDMGDGGVHEALGEYRGGRWSVFGGPLYEKMQVVGWWPLPEKG